MATIMQLTAKWRMTTILVWANKTIQNLRQWTLCRKICQATKTQTIRTLHARIAPRRVILRGPSSQWMKICTALVQMKKKLWRLYNLWVVQVQRLTPQSIIVLIIEAALARAEHIHRVSGQAIEYRSEERRVG